MAILDGYKKMERYVNTESGHQKISQWTSSNTVELNDGTTLEETIVNKADLDNSGQVKLEQIPKVALDKLVKVENDTARFALTTDDVQTGDTVLVADTERMYLVVDDTKLDNDDGYTGYSATTTWETIEGKPENLGEVVHLTQAEYDTLPDSKLTDGVVYMITDAEGGSSSGGSNIEVIDNLTTEDATKALSANQGKVLNDKVDEATNIAKGKNRAHVFSTTEAMQTWLSDENNKGLYNVGDNLYIVDVDVPDWWISAVLDTADASTGYYYNIAQLETQKVDLTSIETELANLNAAVSVKQATITGGATSITSSNLTANRALISDANGKVAVSSNITTTELGYLDGVTSNIQTQLNALTTYANEATSTVNNTYASGTVTWKRMGKIVIVDVYDLTFKANTGADGSTHIILSGLPKSKRATSNGVSSVYAENKSIRIGIANNGTDLCVWWQSVGSSDLAGYNGQLVYVVA